jgi:hypothetical protein
MRIGKARRIPMTAPRLARPSARRRGGVREIFPIGQEKTPERNAPPGAEVRESRPR